MRAVAERADLAQEMASGRKAILFHATWCPFCRAFKPRFEELVTPGTGFEPLEVLLDDEENPLWGEFQIETIPTVLFFVDGRQVGRSDAVRDEGLGEQEFLLSMAQSLLT